MDIKKATWALENLFQRIEPNAVGNWELKGPITIGEREALASILEHLGSDVKSEPVQEFPAQKNPPDVVLNLDSTKLTTPEEPSIIMCLDFGTAMSKAFAIDDDANELIDIAIGNQSGYTESIHGIPSSIFISVEGLIFLGHKALGQSQSYIDGRQRFDSPKQELSMALMSEFSSASVDKSINPTDIIFTKEELITLYLAYLTDMACTNLVKQHGHSRYVKRRFARPCWDNERASWAEARLKIMLSKAQVLADTFNGKWDAGLDVTTVRSALNQLKTIDLPHYLISGGVEEPVAAAASIVLKGERDHAGFLIVDIGAGTTDFGLFLVTQPKNSDNTKIFRVPGSIHGIRQAGDTIDNHLQSYILKKHSVDESPYGKRISAELNSNIRRYKENLFRDEELLYSLVDDTTGEISLAEFLASAEVLKFSEVLRRGVQKTFDLCDVTWIRKLKDPGITLVLTGGGARLPMVKGIASMIVTTHGMNISLHPAPVVPAWITDDNREFEEEFPQLAVAMGGASFELPEMGPDVIQLGGLVAPTYVASNLQTKGL